MRTAPAFQLCPQRSSGWSILVVALFAATTTLSLWWALEADGARRGLALLAALWSLGCAGWHAQTARRTPAVGSLRWDGQCWHWGPAQTRGHEPLTGSVQVAIDCSGFILLQLRPQASAGSRFPLASTWLPLSRRGHAAAWHSLRCALHAPAAPALKGAAA